MIMKHAVWLLALMCCAFAAPPSNTCDYNSQPWLGTNMVLNCHTDVVDARCYVYVNESVSGTAVEVIPDTAFSAYDEAIHPLPGGSFAVQWELNSAKYMEGANYTFFAYCENSTGDSDDRDGWFEVQGFAAPSWAASYMTYGMENAAYVVGGMLIIGALFTLALFVKGSYGF